MDIKDFTAVIDGKYETGLECVQNGKIYLLRLAKEKLCGCRNVRLLERISLADAGEDGFFVLPRSTSMKGDMQVFFTKRADTEYRYGKPTAAVYGIKTPRGCCIVRFKRNYKFMFWVRCVCGRYSVCLEIDFEKGEPPYEDICLEVIKLDRNAEISDMARAERDCRLERNEITALKQKCSEFEAVEYARRYPLIRIRMAWKRSPCLESDLSQTPETEPPLHIACDFARVRDIADALYRHGVGGADIQLVGWNIGGHDGRFPQHLPPDPRLGGETELLKTVKHVKSLGYRISLHTNSIDAYEIAQNYNPDDRVVTKDGGFTTSGRLSGGQAYRICPVRQYENTLRDMPPLKSLGMNGLHFTDVVSIIEPETCYCPLHPCSTAKGIEYIQKLMEYTRKLFGGFSSEGCMDFAMKYMDYGLYTTFGDSFAKTDIDICSRYVPFFEQIYHGIIMYNPASRTINYPLKSKRDRLALIMRGGRPSFYFYSKFKTGAVNWMGETDLECDTDEKLEKCASLIAESQAEYTKLCGLQTQFMERYDFYDGEIEVASYSDGTRIVGNFSDSERVFEGASVPPYDYIILK